MGLFNKKELKRIAELEATKEDLENQISVLNKRLEENIKFMNDNKITDCQTATNFLNETKEEIALLLKTKNEYQNDIQYLYEQTEISKITLAETIQKREKQETTFNNLKEKTKNLKKYSKDIQEAIRKYHEYDDEQVIEDILAVKYADLEPNIELKLNCFNMKELRKKYKENEKLISMLLEQYKSRYTTKANQTIYQLMVIGLKAELQNTLYNLKYEKENVSIDYIHDICEKYRYISSNGNQSIAKTISKFISELEILFKNAINIEYEYYVQKERQTAEQAAIREQIRQEAEERRILEQQRKQVEKEESKYQTEMDNVKELLSKTQDNNMIQKYLDKIKDLEAMLAKVEDKKEEIINRQNGKAGNVYVISNLGSFGEDVFKVGMTRRLEPMDRVRELGDASVPFSFDVHAMIFSEDAVALESKLHHLLDKYRLNKINVRKEFFKVDIDTIKDFVFQEDPAADFNETMLAEEYRQSLSIEE